jgi:hypothetical protein
MGQFCCGAEQLQVETLAPAQGKGETREEQHWRRWRLNTVSDFCNTNNNQSGGFREVVLIVFVYL